MSIFFFGYSLLMAKVLIFLYGEPATYPCKVQMEQAKAKKMMFLYGIGYKSTNTSYFMLLNTLI